MRFLLSSFARLSHELTAAVVNALGNIRWLLVSPRARVGVWQLWHILLFSVFCLILYALVPRFLLQDHDGQSAYYNIAGIFEWRRSWLESSTFSPLYGEGSPFWPYNPSFIPFLWPYALTSSPEFRIYFEMVIAAATIFSASVLLYRSMRLRPWLVIFGAWVTFAIVMLQSIEWMRGTDAVLEIALCSVCIACLIEIGCHKRSTTLLWGAGFVITFAVMVFAHPGWFVLATPAMAFLALCVIVGSDTWRQAAVRAAAVTAAVVPHIVYGSFESIYFLFVNTARVLRPDAYLPFDHVVWLAGLLFRSDATEIVASTLLIIGLGMGQLPSLSGRPRMATIIWIAAIIIFAGSAIVGLLFLSDVELLRNLKPSYLTPFFLPLAGLFIALGIRACWQWSVIFRASLMVVTAFGTRLLLTAVAFFGLMAWHATHEKLNWPIIAIVILIFGVEAALAWFRRPFVAAFVFIVCAFFGLFIHAAWTDSPFPDERDGLVRMAIRPNPIVTYLSDHVGLTPGAAFRGYADDSYDLSRQNHQLIDNIIGAWGTNWVFYGHGMKLFNWSMSGIPILSTYSPYIDPLYFTFFSAFFNAPQQQQVVNYLAITEIDLRVLQLLGLRYIATNKELAGTRLVAQWQSIWINELPEPNLASYTPTSVFRAANASTTIARIRDKSFDPRKEVVVEDASAIENLVPTTPAELIFERGGYHVEAHSPGRSLIVLPIQYSHCFVVVNRSGDPDVRLLRVNLFQTGLLFSRRVILKMRYERWPLATPKCQRQDYEDSIRLLR